MAKNKFVLRVHKFVIKKRGNKTMKTSRGYKMFPPIKGAKPVEEEAKADVADLSVKKHVLSTVTFKGADGNTVNLLCVGGPRF